MLIALLLSLSAMAGLFEPVRSRDPLPARQVERSPVLPMGWSQLKLGLSRRVDGDLLQSGRDLDLRHGLTRRVHARLALHHRTHVHDDLGSTGFAEPSFGFRGVVAQREIGGTWLAWDLDYRAPFGADHPGPERAPAISEPNPRALAGLVFRQRSGGARVEVGARGGADLPGAVGFGVPDPCADVWDSPVARISGAPVVEGWLSALLQAGPLVFEGALEASAWGARELGAAPSDGEVVCRTVPSTGSGGGSLDGGHVLDGQIGGGIQLSRGVTGRFSTRLPIREGGGLRPVEHARGTQLSGSLEVAF